MKILVPTNLISAGVDPSTGHKQLRFTHITEDAGTGPFEIDPTYNAATGTATFVQSIYNSPSPGTWSFDHTVPVAATGVFDAPSDYQFPLTKFTLNSVNADGSIGSVLATSPKTDYCITGDNRVGDVPNTPNQTFIPANNCDDPTKPLGWSVGWGDQYDQTDAGQPIDINGLPDGTYILHATVDPQHVLTESDPTNNVTDTKLVISGNNVTVISQTNPGSTQPSVSVTSPAANTTVSGTVQVQAAATPVAPATITSVQFLLDGQPLGAPVTQAPYSFNWTVGSTAAGAHTLSAQATDSNGLVGTAVPVPVNVSAQVGSFTIDREMSQTGKSTASVTGFSTSSGNEQLLAFVSSDGRSGQTDTVSGGGLTWTLVKRANAQPGDTAIWQASAPAVLSNAAFTSTATQTGYNQLFTVVAVQGASGVGASAAASAAGGASSVSYTATAAGSLGFAVGNDFSQGVARTPGSDQTILSQSVNTTTGDTFWTQSTSSPVAAAGNTVTLNDTAPTGDVWNMAGVELVPSSTVTPPPDTTPPTVALTNPTSGQTVSGTIPVAANASDNVAVASVQFLLDGQPLGSAVTAAPYAISWDTTAVSVGAHTLSAIATDTSGNTTTATAVPVTVQNPAPPMTCFVLQAQTTAHGTGAVTTSAFHTAAPGETLLAFVSSDGPSTAKQTATVSGAGLTWKLVGRANSQPGDSEVWEATAPTVLTAATVKSTPAKGGYDQDLTVVAYEEAAGAGAVVTGGAATGAPSLSLTTSKAASLVFAVGNDWDNATARTLPMGDVMLEQQLDTHSGDTFWSEYTNQTTGPAGSLVKIGATAPTNHHWNMVAVELLNSGS